MANQCGECYGYFLPYEGRIKVSLYSNGKTVSIASYHIVCFTAVSGDSVVDATVKKIGGLHAANIHE